MKGIRTDPKKGTIDLRIGVVDLKIDVIDPEIDAVGHEIGETGPKIEDTVPEIGTIIERDQGIDLVTEQKGHEIEGLAAGTRPMKGGGIIQKPVVVTVIRLFQYVHVHIDFYMQLLLPPQ